MQVAIYGRLIKKDALPDVQQLFDLLHTRNIKCLIHEEYYPHLVNNIQFKQHPEIFYEKDKDKIKNIDFMFSVGGDGTLLDTITIVKDNKVPIVGINIGRLGFLASIGKDGIEDMIDALEQGTPTSKAPSIPTTPCDTAYLPCPGEAPTSSNKTNVETRITLMV